MTLSKCSKGNSFVLTYKKMKSLYRERARLVLGQALVPASCAGLNPLYLLQERLRFLVWDLCALVDSVNFNPESVASH